MPWTWKATDFVRKGSLDLAVVVGTKMWFRLGRFFFLLFSPLPFAARCGTPLAAVVAVGAVGAVGAADGLLATVGDGLSGSAGGSGSAGAGAGADAAGGGSAGFFRSLQHLKHQLMRESGVPGDSSCMPQTPWIQ